MKEIFKSVIIIMAAMPIMVSCSDKDEPTNEKEDEKVVFDRNAVHDWMMDVTETWENTASNVGEFGGERDQWYATNIGSMNERNNESYSTREWILYCRDMTLNEIEEEIDMILSWNWGEEINGVWSYDAFYITLTNLDNPDEFTKTYVNDIK